MNGYVLQLKLFDEFKCIGGSCPTSCCMYWDNISWREQEVKALLEKPCSEKLSKLVKTSFVKSSESRYSIIEESSGCPFLDDDKFCMIQRELGHGYLSATCQSYPRKSWYNSGVVTKALNCSCYEVLDMLCRDESCTDLVLRERRTHTESVNKNETLDYISEHLQVTFRNDILRLLHEVLYDKSYSMETGIILGALAMQKISQYADNGHVQKIPEVIKAIKPQLKSRTQIEKMENIKPNYDLKFALVEGILSDIMASDTLHNEDGSPSKEKYIEGERKFAEALKGRKFAMRNIVINLMFDTQMPCLSADHTLYENYCFFVFCAASIKYISASMGYYGGDIELGFKRAAAYICRNYCHNTSCIEKVLARMKQLNCTSPAYLASLIK